MLHREIYKGLAAVPGTAQQAIAAKANSAEALAAVQGEAQQAIVSPSQQHGYAV